MKYLWKPPCWQNCAHNRRSVSFNLSLHASGRSGKVWYTRNWGLQIANIGHVIMFFSTWKNNLHMQILVFCIYTKTSGHRWNVFIRAWSPKWYKAKLRPRLWCAWGGRVAFHLGCCPAFLMPWAGPATAHESLRLQKPFQVCLHWSQRCDYSSETHTWGSFTWHGPSADSNVATAACRWAQAAGNLSLWKCTSCLSSVLWMSAFQSQLALGNLLLL